MLIFATYILFNVYIVLECSIVLHNIKNYTETKQKYHRFISKCNNNKTTFCSTKYKRDWSHILATQLFITDNKEIIINVII